MLKGLFRLPEKDKSQVKNNENTKKYDEIWNMMFTNLISRLVVWETHYKQGTTKWQIKKLNGKYLYIYMLAAISLPDGFFQHNV